MPMSDDWFMKFSNTKKVKIVQYDPKIKDIFEEFKQILIQQLGKIEIKHMGASALSISGQGEIDLYIPTTPTKFNSLVKEITKLYGKPGSLDNDWARFNYTYKNTEIEIMVMHKNCSDYIDNTMFFNYLKTHPIDAKKYEQLKQKYAKVSKREYYKQKGIFIRNILKL
jgi:GrpB-like predicted nucleotidyltransferase (UPF0157 family)